MPLSPSAMRWVRTCSRMSGSARSIRNASVSSKRKRRRQCATTILQNMSTSTINIADHANKNYVTLRGISTVGFCRHHSSISKSMSTTTTTPSTFRNPLHRNPSRISSAVGSIYKPPDYFLGIDNDDGDGNPMVLPCDDMALMESIRSCIKIDEDEYDDNDDDNNNNDDDNNNNGWNNLHEKGLNTEMSLCFLGTGAGSPANIRSTSGTLLKLAGTNYLFDVGEGIQRQLQFAKGKGSTIQKIEKIFITHMHGDHLFGLPGLLLSLQTSCTQSDDNYNNRTTGKKQVEEQQEFTVKIYGPPGLFNYIASSITLSCTKLHLLNVEVYELMGGRVRRVATSPPNANAGRHLPRGSSNRQQQQQSFRDPFHDEYPEFRHNGGRIQRFQIPCENGVWNIQDNTSPMTRDDILSGSGSGGRKTVVQQCQERTRIRAAEVDHLPGVVTFGFVVEEEEPPRNLDVQKARSLGVSYKDKKYDLLRHGFAVTADLDGSERRVEPHEVLKSSTTKKSRKIAFIGDNRAWTRQMTDIARNADILVHEATLLEEDYKRGHSTAAMAGRNAANCDAKLLILNHISPKMEMVLSGIVEEAYNASDKKLSVLMSFDFMEVLVPWVGFGTASAISGCDSDNNTGTASVEDDSKKATRAKITDWAEAVFPGSKDN